MANPQDETALRSELQGLLEQAKETEQVEDLERLVAGLKENIEIRLKKRAIFLRREMAEIEALLGNIPVSSADAEEFRRRKDELAGKVENALRELDRLTAEFAPLEAIQRQGPGMTRLDTGEQPVILPDGSEYRGILRNGIPHAEGWIRQPDGYTFEGLFNMGHKVRGKSCNQAGQLVYEGEFGPGSGVLAAFDVYQGFGSLYEPDKGIMYEGQFKNDEFDGYGRFYYEDRSYITGYFKDGKLHGLATRYSADGQVIRRSLWEKSKEKTNFVGDYPIPDTPAMLEVLRLIERPKVKKVSRRNDRTRQMEEVEELVGGGGDPAEKMARLAIIIDQQRQAARLSRRLHALLDSAATPEEKIAELERTVSLESERGRFSPQMDELHALLDSAATPEEKIAELEKILKRERQVAHLSRQFEELLNKNIPSKDKINELATRLDREPESGRLGRWIRESLDDDISAEDKIVEITKIVKRERRGEQMTIEQEQVIEGTATVFQILNNQRLSPADKIAKLKIIQAGLPPASGRLVEELAEVVDASLEQLEEVKGQAAGFGKFEQVAESLEARSVNDPWRERETNIYYWLDSQIVEILPGKTRDKQKRLRLARNGDVVTEKEFLADILPTLSLPEKLVKPDERTGYQVSHDDIRDRFHQWRAARAARLLPRGAQQVLKDIVEGDRGRKKEEFKFTKGIGMSAATLFKGIERSIASLLARDNAGMLVIKEHFRPRQANKMNPRELDEEYRRFLDQEVSYERFSPSALLAALDKEMLASLAARKITAGQDKKKRQRPLTPDDLYNYLYLWVSHHDLPQVKRQAIRRQGAVMETEYEIEDDPHRQGRKRWKSPPAAEQPYEKGFAPAQERVESSELQTGDTLHAVPVIFSDSGSPTGMTTAEVTITEVAEGESAGEWEYYFRPVKGTDEAWYEPWKQHASRPIAYFTSRELAEARGLVERPPEDIEREKRERIADWVDFIYREGWIQRTTTGFVVLVERSGRHRRDEPDLVPRAVTSVDQAVEAILARASEVNRQKFDGREEYADPDEGLGRIVHEREARPQLSQLQEFARTGITAEYLRQELPQLISGHHIDRVGEVERGSPVTLTVVGTGSRIRGHLASDGLVRGQEFTVILAEQIPHSDQSQIREPGELYTAQLVDIVPGASPDIRPELRIAPVATLGAKVDDADREITTATLDTADFVHEITPEKRGLAMDILEGNVLPRLLVDEEQIYNAAGEPITGRSKKRLVLLREDEGYLPVDADTMRVELMKNIGAVTAAGLTVEQMLYVARQWIDGLNKKRLQTVEQFQLEQERRPRTIGDLGWFETSSVEFVFRAGERVNLKINGLPDPRLEIIREREAFRIAYDREADLNLTYLPAEKRVECSGHAKGYRVYAKSIAEDKGELETVFAEFKAAVAERAAHDSPIYGEFALPDEVEQTETLPDGRIRLVYRNGSAYEGEADADGQPHGRGEFGRYDGRRAVGSFVHGAAEGALELHQGDVLLARSAYTHGRREGQAGVRRPDGKWQVFAYAGGAVADGYTAIYSTEADTQPGSYEIWEGDRPVAEETMPAENEIKGLGAYDAGAKKFAFADGSELLLPPIEFKLPPDNKLRKLEPEFFPRSAGRQDYLAFAYPGKEASAASIIKLRGLDIRRLTVETNVNSSTASESVNSVAAVREKFNKFLAAAGEAVKPADLEINFHGIAGKYVGQTTTDPDGNQIPDGQGRLVLSDKYRREIVGRFEQGRPAECRVTKNEAGRKTTYQGELNEKGEAHGRGTLWLNDRLLTEIKGIFVADRLPQRAEVRKRQGRLEFFYEGAIGEQGELQSARARLRAGESVYEGLFDKTRFIEGEHWVGATAGSEELHYKGTFQGEVVTADELRSPSYLVGIRRVNNERTPWAYATWQANGLPDPDSEIEYFEALGQADARMGSGAPRQKAKPPEAAPAAAEGGLETTAAPVEVGFSGSQAFYTGQYRRRTDGAKIFYGQGEMRVPDFKIVFTGEFRDQRPVRGRLVQGEGAAATTYEGPVSPFFLPDGGAGVITMPDGRKWSGTFADDHLVGVGQFVKNDELQYEGHFAQRGIFGYSGGVVELPQPEGEGILVRPGGLCEKGRWRIEDGRFGAESATAFFSSLEDARHDRNPLSSVDVHEKKGGVMIRVLGHRLRYEGNTVEIGGRRVPGWRGQVDFEGYIPGSRFEGLFADGKPVSGSIISNNQGSVYTGPVNENFLPHGQAGVYRCGDNEYEGDFINGKLTAGRRLSGESVPEYEGEFAGALLGSDGRWQEPKPHGRGMFFEGDARVTEGVKAGRWVVGEFAGGKMTVVLARFPTDQPPAARNKLSSLGVDYGVRVEQELERQKKVNLFEEQEKTNTRVFAGDILVAVGPEYLKRIAERLLTHSEAEVKGDIRNLLVDTGRSIGRGRVWRNVGFSNREDFEGWCANDRQVDLMYASLYHHFLSAVEQAMAADPELLAAESGRSGIKGKLKRILKSGGTGLAAAGVTALLVGTGPVTLPLVAAVGVAASRLVREKQARLDRKQKLAGENRSWRTDRAQVAALERALGAVRKDIDREGDEILAAHAAGTFTLLLEKNGGQRPVTRGYEIQAEALKQVAKMAQARADQGGDWEEEVAAKGKLAEYALAALDARHSHRRENDVLRERTVDAAEDLSAWQEIWREVRAGRIHDLGLDSTKLTVRRVGIALETVAGATTAAVVGIPSSLGALHSWVQRLIARSSLGFMQGAVRGDLRGRGQQREQAWRHIFREMAGDFTAVRAGLRRFQSGWKGVTVEQAVPAYRIRILEDLMAYDKEHPNDRIFDFALRPGFKKEIEETLRELKGELVLDALVHADETLDKKLLTERKLRAQRQQGKLEAAKGKLFEKNYLRDEALNAGLKRGAFVAALGAVYEGVRGWFGGGAGGGRTATASQEQAGAEQEEPAVAGSGRAEEPAQMAEPPGEPPADRVEAKAPELPPEPPPAAPDTAAPPASEADVPVLSPELGKIWDREVLNIAQKLNDYLQGVRFYGNAGTGAKLDIDLDKIMRLLAEAVRNAKFSPEALELIVKDIKNGENIPKELLESFTPGERIIIHNVHNELYYTEEGSSMVKISHGGQDFLYYNQNMRFKIVEGGLFRQIFDPETGAWSFYERAQIIGQGEGIEPIIR